MIALLTAAALAASADTRAWSCRNDVEVACADGACAASPKSEFTPLDIAADTKGEVSVCVYSGCWTTSARPVRRAGRLLWSIDRARWSDKPETDARITLLVDTREGVGFVRVDSFASPLICRPF